MTRYRKPHGHGIVRLPEGTMAAAQLSRHRLAREFRQTPPRGTAKTVSG